MPDKLVNFPLEWPLLRVTNQSMSNRIASNIRPLLIIPFTASDLTIPETSLPERSFVRQLPISADKAFPTGHPAFQGKSAAHHRGTKNMDMIRENNKPSGRPMAAWFPN